VNHRQAQERAAIMRALAHPVRVLLVDALASGERCVCELNRVADVDQSRVSRHLSALRRAGIVSCRRDGMRVFYRLETPCILRAFSCAAQVVRSGRGRGGGVA